MPSMPLLTWLVLIHILSSIPVSSSPTCRACDGPVTNGRRPRGAESTPTNTSTYYGDSEYYLALLLASRAGTIFDYEKVLPAVEIAVEKANVDILRSVNTTLRLVSAAYGNTCTADGASGKAAEFVRDVPQSKLIGFIGPACSDALDHVARLSAYLNITTVTGLGDERQFVDKTHFGTLTRLAYCQCRLRRVVSAMLGRFDWAHLSILYDSSDYFSRTIGQSIDEGLREPAVGARLNVTPFVESFESALDPNYEAMLKRASEDARIIVLSVTGDVLRSIMLAGSRLGMTKGEWVFVDVELFPSYMFGNKHWKRNDSYDEMAKEAYRSLIRISIKENQTSPEYKQFAMDVVKRSTARFGSNVFRPEEKINFFIGAFHDAVIVLAEVLKLAILDGANPHDGYALRLYFRRWWTSQYLVTGSLHINANNDRDTEYLYLDMDKETGEFQTVATYDAVLGGFNTNSNAVIDWPNGSPPPDIPFCGFRRENPACADSTSGIVQWVTMALLATSLCAMVALFLFYRRRKEKQLLMQSNWRVSWNELQKRPMAAGSIRSFGSNEVGSHRPVTAGAASVIGARSVNSDNHRSSYHTETAVYQGAVVALKTGTMRSDGMDKDKAVALEMIKWKNGVHENVIRVIGACVDGPSQCLVTEYCMRSSVEDLIGQDRIDLDRQFQLSILYDIANGLLYIHKSLKISHGRLTSSNCLVDARFVVKLADWNMECMRRPQHTQHKTEEKMLYQAPEIVRNIVNQSQQGDIYSFGMTAVEVLSREQPYGKEREEMEIKDIIANVLSGSSPPFRPDLINVSWISMQRLVSTCLEENPAVRPAASSILAKLRQENKGRRINILDSLLMRMEKYTTNLESIVEERTQELVEEKKKMQSLLFELLPPPIASQLIDGGRVVPEAYNSVTIYFSDIVGFTSLSAESSPMEVVNLLNDLYTRFDDILSNFAVYKVETIGDAYMVVSGLPTRNGIEHARQISRMALSLLTAVRTFKVAHRPDHVMKLRIGLHSGSCVAGVVGLKMPRYCLFGDTVNTASRMESNGEALKIHVSQATKDLLDKFGTFELIERGEVAMKGKGVQLTYWLLSENTV